MTAPAHLRLVQSLIDDDTGEVQGLCRCGCGGKTSVAERTRTGRGDVAGQPRKYLFGHRSRLNGPDYVEEDRGHTTMCWLWQKTVNDRGYGYVVQARQKRCAHIVYYERHVGPVPEGLELDHLCRVRPCVNPDHLEPVTSQENTRRGARTKLTPDAVREIREAHSRGVSHRTISVRFDISKSYVSKIVTRRSWGDVA